MAERIEETKIVTFVDLAGYSDIAKLLEESLGPKAVGELNDQVQNFIADAFKTSGSENDGTVEVTTGDGAIITFESAEQSIRFSLALHSAANQFSANKDTAQGQRFFRVGCAKGPIAINLTGDGAKSGLDGFTTTRAARLEAKAELSSVLIDEDVYTDLPHDLKERFDGPLEIAGKRNEVFKAYQLIQEGEPTRASEKGPRPSTLPRQDLIRELRDALNALESYEIDLVLLELEIDPSRWPSDKLAVANRSVELIKIADRGSQLAELEAAIISITGGVG